MNVPGVSAPKFYSFWTINGPLESGRLRTQLDGFRAAGLDGVVFHPRFYPGTPPPLSEPYFALVSDAILHARSIGLAFWLYDEDGWPSGTVGGQLLRQFPEHAQRWVGVFEQPAASTLATFTHEGKVWHLFEHRGAGVDYLDPSLYHRFITMTHERYRDNLSPEAFAHMEVFFATSPSLSWVTFTILCRRAARSRGHRACRNSSANVSGKSWSRYCPRCFSRSRAMRKHASASGHW